MTHEHPLGAIARLATHFRLFSVLTLLLAASGSLYAAAPVADDDVYGGQKDKTLAVDAANGVLANDTDADSDPLTAILVDGSAADAKGTLVLNADGSFTFDPDDNTTYITTFTYKANDNTNDSNVATVVISISNNGKLPEAPIAEITADTTAGPATLTVNFDGSGSQPGDGASLDNFIWDFGDGNSTDSGATDNVSHGYTTPGLFIASLTVKDDLPLTSETVFLPILVSDGTTGDGRLYVKKAQFAISWSKHAGGVDADKFKISGVWNPSGFPANLDLSGMTVDVLINGQSVNGQVALDASGKFASLKGASPSLKFAFKAKNGAFALSGSLLDLRGFLGVVDANDPGSTLPVAVEVILGGTITPANDDCFVQMNALYTSTKGKGAKASYAFAKVPTPTGNFVSLKTSGTENPDTGGHKISASGVIAGDLGTAIDPNGTMTLTIGGAGPISIDPSDVTVTDSGVDTVITLNKGAVTELSKFTISNPKGKFQIATNELTGVGLDAAGFGGTEDTLAITLVVPTADGPLTFATIVELFRSDITSTKWKR